MSSSITNLGSNGTKAKPPPKRTSLLAKQGFSNVANNLKRNNSAGRIDQKVGDDMNLNKKGAV